MLCQDKQLGCAEEHAGGASPGVQPGLQDPPRSLQPPSTQHEVTTLVHRILCTACVVSQEVGGVETPQRCHTSTSRQQHQSLPATAGRTWCIPVAPVVVVFIVTETELAEYTSSRVACGDANCDSGTKFVQLRASFEPGNSAREVLTLLSAIYDAQDAPYTRIRF